jgi:hypothetical protein
LGIVPEQLHLVVLCMDVPILQLVIMTLLLKSMMVLVVLLMYVVFVMVVVNLVQVVLTPLLVTIWKQLFMMTGRVLIHLLDLIAIASKTLTL